MATHCSILAWEVPRTEEPGGLQSMGSKRAGHDSETKEQQGNQTAGPPEQARRGSRAGKSARRRTLWKVRTPEASVAKSASDTPARTGHSLSRQIL